MPIELWTSGQLFATLTDERMNAVPSHFLDTFFTETFYSAEKEILISELPAADRMMAPFVLPTEQGKPIYSDKAETVKSLLPAYIKVKDAVRPVEARTPLASELLTGVRMSLQERFDMALDKRITKHLRAIAMREAWMAARAFIDGSVIIRYDRDQGTAFPEVTISFGRDAGHYVVKGANFWDNSGTLILDDIQGWADTMFAAVRGGFPSRLYVGSAVAAVFKKNAQVRAEMDMTVRGTEVNIKSGLISRAEPLNYLGVIGAGIEVWAYRDDVEAPNGALTPILNPKEILLVAPGATGVRAFGAIYDVDALGGEGVSAQVFPKMFKTDDPGEIFVMHQSAPLPIPLYPNRTFRAQVLA